jgi:hypothetical protein
LEAGGKYLKFNLNKKEQAVLLPPVLFVSCRDRSEYGEIFQKRNNTDNDDDNLDDLLRAASNWQASDQP